MREWKNARIVIFIFICRADIFPTFSHPKRESNLVFVCYIVLPKAYTSIKGSKTRSLQKSLKQILILIWCVFLLLQKLPAKSCPISFKFSGSHLIIADGSQMHQAKEFFYLLKWRNRIIHLKVSVITRSFNEVTWTLEKIFPIFLFYYSSTK